MVAPVVASASVTDWPVVKTPGAGEKVGAEAVGSIGGGTVPPPEPLDRQLLEAIAPMITPSGTAVFGGRSLLLFGQKKLKVGDTLPIIYKDKPYELTITAIDDGTFTLRLRAEEITRTIKPVPTNPSQP